MSIKSFKEFVLEGTGTTAASNLTPNPQEDESKELKPRSKGEQKFKDDHKVEKTDHPVAGDNQFNGTVDGKLGTHGNTGGEKAVVKQGSSDVKQPAGGTSDGRTQGKPGEKSVINPIK